MYTLSPVGQKCVINNLLSMIGMPGVNNTPTVVISQISAVAIGQQVIVCQS